MVKNLPANVGDAGDVRSVSRSGRSPGVGNGNPLQYSYLDNRMDRGAWWATFHGGYKESDTTQWLSMLPLVLKPSLRGRDFPLNEVHSFHFYT